MLLLLPLSVLNAAEQAQSNSAVLIPTLSADTVSGCSPQLAPFLALWQQLDPKAPDTQAILDAHVALYSAVASEQLTPEQLRWADHFSLVLTHARLRNHAQKLFRQPLNSLKQLRSFLDAAHELASLRQSFPQLVSPDFLAAEQRQHDPAGLQFAKLFEDATPLRPLLDKWKTQPNADGTFRHSCQFTVTPDESALLLNLASLDPNDAVFVNDDPIPHTPHQLQSSFRISLPPDQNGTYTLTIVSRQPIHGDQQPAPWLSQEKNGRRDRGR